MDVANKRSPEHKEASSDARVTEKSAEKSVSATAEIFTTQAEVTSEIADLGIENGGERFSEGEQSGKGKGEGRTHTKSGAPVTFSARKAQPLPPPTVMKKEVIRAITAEIRRDERDIILVNLGIKKMEANVFAEMVARLRQLKELLASLLDVTTDMLKTLYLKWVRKEV